MAITQVQSTFTVGELDPLLWARSETEFYYAGCETLQNYISLPEGPFTLRPGSLYTDRLNGLLTREAAPTISAPNGGTAASANDDNETTFLLTTTNVSTVNPYVVVHYDLGALKNIGVIDVVRATLTTNTNDTEFFVQVSTDNAAWVTQGPAIQMSPVEYTKRVRVRGLYRYMRFVRVGATDMGTDKVSIAEFNVFVEGASYTITTPNGGTGAYARDNDTSTFLLTTVNVSTTDPYVVVHYDLGDQLSIDEISVVNGTLTTATNTDEFFVQVSTDDAVWTSVGGAIPLSPTASTTTVTVGGTYRYVRFTRIGTTDLGTDKVSISGFNVLTTVRNTSIAKRIDFVFNVDQSYVIFMTDKNITIYRNNVFQTDLRANLYTSGIIQNLNYCQSADTAFLFLGTVQTHSLVRFDDTDWTLTPITFQDIPFEAFTPVTTNPAVTLTPSAVEGSVTLTAGGATFTAASVGQYVDGNGGRARIITYTSTTVVQAVTEIPFYTTTAMIAGSWDYETGYEAVWSAARGWPRSGAFFQQRLWMGGSPSKPVGAWATRIGDYFNMDVGAIRDSDAIVFDLDEDDPIINLVSNRTLQIFTTGGEAAIIQTRNVPVTPTQPSIVGQTKEGSEYGLRPVVVDGSTLYMKQGGSTIGRYVYSDTEQSFDTTNLTLLSSHLIKTPIDMANRKSTNQQEASYLMIVNSDGTLTFGCLLDEQNVKGFSQATTDGLYKNVATDGADMYAVVERITNSVANNNVEKFDFNTYSDAAVKYTTGFPTDTFIGLDHLDNKLCRVTADGNMDTATPTTPGNILADVTPIDGSATIERDAVSALEIGLNFQPSFKTLPIEKPDLIGPSLGKTKRITEVALRFYKTSSATVSGNVISFFGLIESLNPLDASNPLFSGVKTVEGLRGWDFNGTITITQDYAFPITVQSIAMKVMVE